MQFLMRDYFWIFKKVTFNGINWKLCLIKDLQYIVMTVNYQHKYLKYKTKYRMLLQIEGGGHDRWKFASGV